MFVLFLSSENAICEQDMLLMLSFAKSQEAFVYACPEGSWLASIAQHNSIATLELPQSFWKQFSTLHLYLRRLRKKTSVQIHVFDTHSLRLAKWLRRVHGSTVQVVASFHDPLLLSVQNPFEEPKALENKQVQNKRLSVFKKLNSIDTHNIKIVKEFLAKKIQCLFVSSAELQRVLETHKISYNSVSLLPYAYRGEDLDFMKIAFENFADFKEDIVLLAKGTSFDAYDKQERFIFLVDCALEEESGFSVLLHALAILKEKLAECQKSKKSTKNDLPKHIQMHICGDGARFQDFIQEAKDLEVDDMIVAFGDFDSSMLYASAHALICPSMAGEGNFRSIIRAWLAKLPVIGSDISPHTKLFLTGKTQRSALIFPRDNADTLAQCMLHVMTDASLREELIHEGSEIVSKIDYLDLVNIYKDISKKYHGNSKK